MRAWLVLFALVMALVPTVAQATPVSLRVCVKYGMNLDDAESTYGDDFWNDGGTTPRAAIGAWVKVRRVTPASATVWNAYTDDGATYSGCTGVLSLDTLYLYEISVTYKNSVDGNVLRIWGSDQIEDTNPDSKKETWEVKSGEVPATEILTSVASPPSSGSFWTFTTSTHGKGFLAAVGAYSLYRVNGGTTGKTFDAMKLASDGGGCVSQRPSVGPPIRNGAVVCGTWDQKYRGAHEFGHLIATANNGDSGPEIDDDEDDEDNNNAYYESPDYNAHVSVPALKDPCLTQSGTWDENDPTHINSPIHDFNSREFQAVAAWEGIAHWYSARVFNSVTQSPSQCWFRPYREVNWNLDFTSESGLWESIIQPDEDRQPTRCDDVPVPSTGGYSQPDDGADYLGACSVGLNLGTTDPVMTNRGTPFDWMRFWWHLNKTEGLSPVQIYDIWDTANPEDWEPFGGGIVPPGAVDCTNPLVLKCPAKKLRDAAIGQGHGTAWDNQDNTHGAHR